MPLFDSRIALAEARASVNAGNDPLAEFSYRTKVPSVMCLTGPIKKAS
jgi:hypothetical protein